MAILHLCKSYFRTFAATMKNVKHIIKKLLASFLLVIFVGAVGSITLFYHTHSVGETHITHSHPYSDAPDTEKHTHTTAEFELISALSTLLMLAASFGCFIIFVAKRISKIILFADNFTFGAIPLILSLRAPPVC